MRLAIRIEVSIRRWVRCACLLTLLSVLLINPLIAGHRPSTKVVVLAHVTVVDIRSGQLRQNQSIVIETERIAMVGPSGAVVVPRGARVINAAGKYVIPGLWDAHVHLSYLGACALP